MAWHRSIASTAGSTRRWCRTGSRTSGGIERASNFRIAIRYCRSALLRWMGLLVELRLSESLEKFSVAVVATDDGRFAYQVFLVCGEPRTLLTDTRAI